jgi:hypothetical protein
MRLAALALIAYVLAVITPSQAMADVLNCGGQQPLGDLTCSTTGPAMIDGSSFVGDGSSSAQLQWVGSTSVSTPGTLTLTYTYTDIFNTLFSKIGIRLTISQLACEEPHESLRDWVDPATMDGVPGQISLYLNCVGTVSYKITSRAATYSPAGSFIGKLTQTDLSFTPQAPLTQP